MRENKLQALIIAYLKANNIYCINYSPKWTGKGVPDILACYKGRFIAIETKVGSNKLEPAQVIHKKRILASGGYHLTPYSLEQFINEFNLIKKEVIK